MRTCECDSPIKIIDGEVRCLLCGKSWVAGRAIEVTYKSYAYIHTRSNGTLYIDLIDRETRQHEWITEDHDIHFDGGWGRMNLLERLAFHWKAELIDHQEWLRLR